MRFPSIVYLDSQDFNRLSDGFDNNEMSSIWKRLIALRDQGCVVYAYSYLHILECLNPDSSGYLEKQRARARLISSLTLGALPFHSDIILGAAFPSQAGWGPMSAYDIGKDFISKAWVDKIFREALSNFPHLSREQRRRLLSKNGKRDLLARSFSSADVPDDLSFYGVTASDVRRILMSPERHGRAVGRKIIANIQDPEKYLDCVMRLRPGENPLRVEFDSNSKIVHGHIEKLNEEFKKLDSLRADIDGAIRELRGIGFSDGPVIQDLRSRKRRLPSRGQIKIPLRPDMDDNRFGHISHFIKRAMSRGGGRKQSDFGDLMHLSYAPDVDFMRVDKDCASMMAGYRPLEGKLFSSIVDLLDHIEDKVETERREGG